MRKAGAARKPRARYWVGCRGTATFREACRIAAALSVLEHRSVDVTRDREVLARFRQGPSGVAVLQCCGDLWVG